MQPEDDLPDVDGVAEDSLEGGPDLLSGCEEVAEQVTVSDLPGGESPPGDGGALNRTHIRLLLLGAAGPGPLGRSRSHAITPSCPPSP